MGNDLANRLLGAIDKVLDKKTYQELHWEGTFEDYFKIVADSPRVLRNAFQRVYDLILAYGFEEYEENREKLVRYWGMRPVSGWFEQHAEVDEIRWLVPEDAAEILTYPRDKAVLSAFAV